MVISTYKGYTEQVTGTNSGTWGTVLNDEAWTFMDTNLGGPLAVSLASSNVSLTAAQARNALVSLTGTLGATVQITSAAQGFTLVENLCTQGAFNVSWTNGVAAVTLPALSRNLLFADATNGVRIIGTCSSSNPTVAPTGTETLFIQTAVPTGWTLKTTWNDYGMYLVNTTGGFANGSVAYSTLFARTTVDAHTLTLAETVLHTHSFTSNCSGDDGAPAAVAYWCSLNSGGGTGVAFTDFQGGGGSHDHTLDLRVLTVTAIIGVRN